MTEEVVRDSPQGCLYNHPAHATLTLPCENNKYAFFKPCDLRAVLHKSLRFWEYYCYLCFTNRRAEALGCVQLVPGMAVPLIQGRGAAQPCWDSCIALLGENKAPLTSPEQMVSGGCWGGSD